MMEKHEVRQLIQGIPVATTVLTRSPLIWSDDNSIALVTQHGTYVLELALSPEECSPAVMFTRYFIPIPDDPSPCTNPGIEITEVIECLEQSSNSQSLMLESVVSSPQRAKMEQDPRNPRTTLPGMPGGEPIHRGYSKGAWSPRGIGENGTSVLSLATRDHKLSICGRVGRHWVTLANLSDVWYTYNSSKSWARTRLPTTAPLHQQYAARIRLLAISHLIWTPVYEDKKGKCSILITLMGNGCAVFWRIDSNFTSAKQASIFSVVETSMSHISAVHWHDVSDRFGYLAVGSSKGEIWIYSCQINETGVNFKSMGNIWDKNDMLCVRHIHLTHVGECQYLAIYSKHNILMASSLDLYESSVDVKHTSHTFIGDLEISGLIVFENHNIYASAKDGIVNHVCVSINEAGEITIEEGDTLFCSDEVMYCGMGSSPNKVLFAVFETIKVAYDHLVEREPTLVNIYRLGDARKLTQILKESPADLHSNADIFESLRICICKAGHCPISFIKANQISKQPLKILKVHYWLMKISRSCGITEEASLLALNKVEPLVQKAIMGNWIGDVIKRHCGTDLPKKPTLLLSLSLMCDWLKKNSRKSMSTLESLLKKLGPAKKELCPVCTKEVPLTSLTHGKCSNGHTLPRCCRSLLLTEPNIICSRCKVFAHKDSQFLTSEKVFRCTYCDGFMVQQLLGRN